MLLLMSRVPKVSCSVFHTKKPLSRDFYALSEAYYYRFGVMAILNYEKGFRFIMPAVKKRKRILGVVSQAIRTPLFLFSKTRLPR